MLEGGKPTNTTKLVLILNAVFILFFLCFLYFSFALWQCSVPMLRVFYYSVAWPLGSANKAISQNTRIDFSKKLQKNKHKHKIIKTKICFCLIILLYVT